MAFSSGNDGIHFRKPQPDFALIKSGPEGSWDQHGLIYGEAFENVGDQTYICYGPWDLILERRSEGAIGLATTRRDGFGYISDRHAGDALLITVPLALHAGTPQVTLNADGLSKDATLRIVILDKNGILSRDIRNGHEFKAERGGAADARRLRLKRSASTGCACTCGQRARANSLLRGHMR